MKQRIQFADINFVVRSQSLQIASEKKYVSVVLLFPNQIRKDNLIQAGKQYQIPSREDSKDSFELRGKRL